LIILGDIKFLMKEKYKCEYMCYAYKVVYKWNLPKKMAGYVLYAIGIVGGVEGATVRGTQGIGISVVALIVIIIASYLLDKKIIHSFRIRF